MSNPINSDQGVIYYQFIKYLTHNESIKAALCSIT
jgi:hypothetical protein